MKADPRPHRGEAIPFGDGGDLQSREVMVGEEGTVALGTQSQQLPCFDFCLNGGLLLQVGEQIFAPVVTIAAPDARDVVHRNGIDPGDDSIWVAQLIPRLPAFGPSGLRGFFGPFRAGSARGQHANRRPKPALVGCGEALFGHAFT